MEPTLTVLALGTLATFVMGVSKTAVPSVGAFGVAVLASILPPLRSTGVALPVLLVGDLLAIGLYARHADPRILLRLLPSVVVGLAAGYAVVRLVDEATAGRVVGAVVLLAALGEWWRRRPTRAPASGGGRVPGGGPGSEGRPVSEGGQGSEGGPGSDGTPVATPGARSPVSVLLGAGAGLSTMIANAGGPLMTLYLLRLRVPTLAFLGTVAWFFFVLNLLKVPFSVGLGLITPESLRLSAMLVPGIVLGGLTGRRLIAHLPRRVFETLALTATTVAGVVLVVG